VILPEQSWDGGLLVSQILLAMDSLKGSDAVIRGIADPSSDSSTRDIWRKWGNTLARWHLAGLVAWLLEAGGPLALVSAQLLYMGRGFLGAGTLSLAHLLESESETAGFIEFLNAREGGVSGIHQGDL
jgi:hypothetical protein